MTEAEILEEFPDLRHDDFAAVYAWAAERAGLALIEQGKGTESATGRTTLGRWLLINEKLPPSLKSHLGV